MEKKNMIKRIFLFLLLAGLLLGPGYWLYVKLHSGKVAMTMNLAAANDGRLTSQPFKLDSDMQPVGLILHAEGSFTPRKDEDKPPKDEYTATVFKDGKILQTVEFPLGTKSVANTKPVFNERLLWLGRVESGTYSIEIRPAGEPLIHLDKPSLGIMANVEEPEGRVVNVGLLLFVIGLFGFFSL
jgi:hypothetical protein